MEYLIPMGTDTSIDPISDSRRSSVQVLMLAGPQAPNESRVTGEILVLEPVHSSALQMAPPQVFTRMRLKLLSIQNVGAMPNPLHGREGEILEVLSRESLKSELVGKVISGTIVFRGDERGGMYWIFDVQSAARD